MPFTYRLTVAPVGFSPISMLISLTSAHWLAEPSVRYLSAAQFKYVLQCILELSDHNVRPNVAATSTLDWTMLENGELEKKSSRFCFTIKQKKLTTGFNFFLNFFFTKDVERKMLKWATVQMSGEAMTDAVRSGGVLGYAAREVQPSAHSQERKEVIIMDGGDNAASRTLSSILRSPAPNAALCQTNFLSSNWSVLLSHPVGVLLPSRKHYLSVTTCSVC